MLRVSVRATSERVRVSIRAGKSTPKCFYLRSTIQSTLNLHLMLRLDRLFLHLQFRYLFICFISFSFPSLFHFHSYSSPNRYSSVNVVLTFNDPLILLAPSAPIMLPVHLFISFSFPSLFHSHSYSYSLPYRYSSVNVVLTFNDSLILFAPSAPILFSFHLFFSFSFVFLFITTQIQFSQCSIDLQ